MRFPLLPVTFVLLLTAAPLFAQDAPPVDSAALLKELYRVRDQQSAQSKQGRQAALQTVNAAASSGEKAAGLWEEAVHAVQFNGVAKENAAFRDWREKEGEALNSPLGKNAARLYFMWASLTIQRDGGAKVKDLLPQIFAYTRELLADEQAAEAMDDAIKREKEAPVPAKKPQPQIGVHKATDDQIRKLHDSILRRPIGASPVAQWMKISDYINPEAWERSPGNFDGIYTQIILPELRAQKDPRALEYWEIKLKKEEAAAARTRLSFELDKFASLRRPQIFWSHAEELLQIGQQNRAVLAMLALIKANPLHPEATNWIGRLEGILAPVKAEGEAAPSPTESK